jgi:hypothetical protein
VIPGEIAEPLANASSVLSGGKSSVRPLRRHSAYKVFHCLDSAASRQQSTQKKYAMETVDDEWVVPPVPIEELDGKSCEFAFTADAKFIFGKGKLVVDHEDGVPRPEARRVRITIVEDLEEGFEWGRGWSRHLRLNAPLAAKLSKPGQFAEYRLFAD